MFAFVLGHYALLGVFALAAYGLGRPISGWIDAELGLPSLLAVPLQLSAGIGVIMVALFASGVLGLFNVLMIAGLLLAGLGLALVPMRQRLGWGKGGMGPVETRRQPISASVGWWTAIIAVTGLPLLLSPLKPPLEWDELMYHLPYARFWAQEGALTVNAWLRYPLFPYNMDLLYGAALVFHDDTLPHLLHALTGALTAVLTFAVAKRGMDRRIGWIAVILLLHATRQGWASAYIDLGLMLFWSCAFAALALRHEGGDRRFAYLAAFFAGIAVGIKYQALFYLPVFAVLALVVERRPAVVARAALIFTVVGGYWYLRHWLISGDPVHPIGGHLFGFWLWNPDDLVGQYGDLDRVRSWPEWYLLPGLGAVLFWRRLSAFHRGLLLSAAASTALWSLASGFPRYLTPVYPMLALLSGFVVIEVWSKSGLDAWSRAALRRADPRLRQVFLPLVFAVVAVNGFGAVSKSLGQLVPRDGERGTYLARRFPGYGLLRSLGHPPVGNLYQLGFEGEIYYLGDSIRGDWFGPGRYSDVMVLAQDAPALARHLERLGADSLLVNLGREPFSTLSWDPGMADHFELVGRSDQAILYRRRGGRTDAGAGSVPTPATGESKP